MFHHKQWRIYIVKFWTRPPRGSKFFQFHAVFGKFWQNRMLAPPESWRPLLGEILDPPLINMIKVIEWSEVGFTFSSSPNFHIFPRVIIWIPVNHHRPHPAPLLKCALKSTNSKTEVQSRRRQSNELLIGTAYLLLFVHLGATKPKTIEPRLLHPWIRSCAHKDSDNKTVLKRKENPDECGVNICFLIKTCVRCL